MKRTVETTALASIALLLMACTGPVVSRAALGPERSAADRASGDPLGAPTRADAAGPELPGEPEILARMHTAGVPGLAVAYLSNCRVRHIATYGVVDDGTRDEVTERTLFEAASLSKPVFAYLLMEMVDLGTFDLDAPIARSLDYPRISDATRYAAVTPRMALSHTTGFPNWAGAPRNWARTDSLVFAFEPGTAFRYSGEGYQLTQLYVERTAGRTLEAVFRASLDELMPSSIFGGTIAEGVPAARGHDRAGSVDGGRAMGDWPRANAAYTLRTTVADYARFVGRVCAGDGLSEAAHAEMLKPHIHLVGDEHGADAMEVEGKLSWALGWGIHTTDDRTLYFHWGDNGPFKAFTAFDPETGDGLVYFANAVGGLDLMELIAAPVVGSVRPISVWLDY